MLCIIITEVHCINCRSTEDSHVKTNLVHTLYRVQKYGLLPMDRFNEMLRPSEVKRCGAQKMKKTWYSMPAEVFTSFVFRVRKIGLISIFITYLAILFACIVKTKRLLEDLWTCAARDHPSSRCRSAKVQ